MKSFKILALIVLGLIAQNTYSQEEQIQENDTIFYSLSLTDGTEWVGNILSQDPREVLILTLDKRKIYIPQYVIREIKIVNKNEIKNAKTYIGNDNFATRYFITTNGLSLEKSGHYIQWNLFGPDFQFAISESFGMGIMTTWLGIPIVANAKKSFTLNDKTQFALGSLFITGSWGQYDSGGILPFATLSFGNKMNNIAFSGGYTLGFIGGEIAQSPMFGVGGMKKISTNLSLVFDSFIVTSDLGNYHSNDFFIENFALIIPGLRWHINNKSSFQFGFPGLFVDKQFYGFPIIQWYRAFK